MDRLTKKKKNRGIFEYDSDRVYGIICDHLGKYEDTGLTPEEVKRLQAERDAAVEDMKIAASQGLCMVCKNSRFLGLCHKCDRNVGYAWEWRGVKESEECQHEKVYDTTLILASDPPQARWICCKCLEEGRDPLWLKTDDYDEYKDLLNKKYSGVKE